MEETKKPRIMNKFISKSDEETQKFAEDFSKNLKNGDVVLLYGDLGFGKTTFTKGLARGLGIKSRIISPTFVIQRSYSNLKHIDLYRIEDPSQLDEVGIDEIIADPNSIKVVEWAEKLVKLPDSRWEIRFNMDDGDTRKVEVTRYG